MREFSDEDGGDTQIIEQLDAKKKYAEIRQMMNKLNPLITQVFDITVIILGI